MLTQVFAQRRPAFHRLLDWEDECFALVTALLDRQVHMSWQRGSYCELCNTLSVKNLVSSCTFCAHLLYNA